MEAGAGRDADQNAIGLRDTSEATNHIHATHYKGSTMIYELYDIKEEKWKFGEEQKEMTEEEARARNVDLERRKSDFRWMVRYKQLGI